MSNSKYTCSRNLDQPYGWTNFETWKVAVEVFGGCDEVMSADECEQFAEEAVLMDAPPTFESIARAFLDEVNWHEIADTLNEGAVNKEIDAITNEQEDADFLDSLEED
jgi:hypothetical protein